MWRHSNKDLSGTCSVTKGNQCIFLERKLKHLLNENNGYMPIPNKASLDSIHIVHAGDAPSFLLKIERDVMYNIIYASDKFYIVCLFVVVVVVAFSQRPCHLYSSP